MCQDPQAHVFEGDCRGICELVLGENSFDAVVTDPPYGLSKEPDAAEVLRHWLAGDDYKATGGGFMGKTWDSFVPGPATWREVYRVLKPGGHALVFAGSRTQDLMSLALRLAGFEIRDTAMWLYGSGFPKSLDVSKAVDASDAAAKRRERDLTFTAWMRSTGITARQINEATGSNMASHYLTDKEQPAVATLDMFEKMRHLLPEPPAEILELMQQRTVESENMKRRAVVGVQKGAMAGWSMDGTTKFTDRDITTPHTDAARQWEGWGTALKPAYEPVIIARKPLIGTVADNVLRFGTGAVNIDGCRINYLDATDQASAKPQGRATAKSGALAGGVQNDNDRREFTADNTKGRWPANVIHDGLGEEWARYFYCPKASKADRNEGLDHLAERTAGECTDREDGSAGLNSPRTGAGRTSGAKNHHPTVKPTELMRYLCRLVTPPGGTVLDPFMGSGSTGKAAVLEGFNFVGIEQDAGYVEIARARIAHATEAEGLA